MGGCCGGEKRFNPNDYAFNIEEVAKIKNVFTQMSSSEAGFDLYLYFTKASFLERQVVNLLARQDLRAGFLRTRISLESFINGQSLLETIKTLLLRHFFAFVLSSLRLE